MSIRRTRQQKMNAELRHEGAAVRYEPSKQSVANTKSEVLKPQTESQKKITSFFIMDMQKTAASTLIVLIMLGVTFWLLR